MQNLQVHREVEAAAHPIRLVLKVGLPTEAPLQPAEELAPQEVLQASLLVAAATPKQLPAAEAAPQEVQQAGQLRRAAAKAAPEPQPVEVLAILQKEEQAEVEDNNRHCEGALPAGRQGTTEACLAGRQAIS